MTACTLNAHEKWVLANAEYFTAIKYLGRKPGRRPYERHEFPTREQAIVKASELTTDIRGALVYAVFRTHDALTDTLPPRKSRRAA